MSVCVCLCVSVCVYVCLCVSVCVSLCIFKPKYIHTNISTCTYKIDSDDDDDDDDDDNCFFGMVDQQKTFSLISYRDHNCFTLFHNCFAIVLQDATLFQYRNNTEANAG